MPWKYLPNKNLKIAILMITEQTSTACKKRGVKRGIMYRQKDQLIKKAQQS